MPSPTTLLVTCSTPSAWPMRMLERRAPRTRNFSAPSPRSLLSATSKAMGIDETGTTLSFDRSISGPLSSGSSGSGGKTVTAERASVSRFGHAGCGDASTKRAAKVSAFAGVCNGCGATSFAAWSIATGGTMAGTGNADRSGKLASAGSVGSAASSCVSSRSVLSTGSFGSDPATRRQRSSPGWLSCSDWRSASKIRLILQLPGISRSPRPGRVPAAGPGAAACVQAVLRLMSSSGGVG